MIFLSSSKKNLVFDIIIIFLIWLFLLTFFSPGLLFLNTRTAGGDTASHYYTAQYLKEVLLPQGKIMGWLQANYAGFPLFYHYFPLAFLLMALLGYIIPLSISFKLITVLGTFLLPLCVYLMFRILKYDDPVPIAGGIISLAFLFNEQNSMWGGNIPSTLAGEFSFSLSLAIFALFLATFYQGIIKNKHVVLNAFLFFLMGFSHGYTLVFFGFLSLFFLLNRDWLKNLWYMLRVYALGAMFLAFWLIPFIANLAYVTPFNITWIFTSVWEVFPPILIPFFILSIVALVLNWRDQRTLFFGFAILLGGLLFFIGPKIGLVDIRFLTFLQFFLAIFGAAALHKVASHVRFHLLIPIILFLTMLLWVNENTNFIKGWINWNYSGFEEKSTWPEVKEMLDYLRETDDKSRVVYENSTDFDSFGSQRIFESLRMFSGRDTLEGLYMQSSITAPFVFYIQSEISKDVSAPFWSYKVSSFNLKNGARHLRAFNVGQFIVRSDKVKKAIRNLPDFRLEKSFGVCDVYRVVGEGPHYVVPARYEPVLYTGKDWKRSFYDWFKNTEIQDVPVVLEGQTNLETEDASELRKIPLSLPKYVISEKIGLETIEFETSLLNHPHIIRVSYHPNWKVEGADKVYLTAPSFMLVYPKENNVKLTFSKNKFNYLGEGITVFALLGMAFFFYAKKRKLI